MPIVHCKNDAFWKMVITIMTNRFQLVRARMMPFGKNVIIIKTNTFQLLCARMMPFGKQTCLDIDNNGKNKLILPFQ